MLQFCLPLSSFFCPKAKKKKKEKEKEKKEKDNIVHFSNLFFQTEVLYMGLSSVK